MDFGDSLPVPRPHFSASGSSRPHDSALAAEVAAAASATRDWLLARQHEGGYWCGELEGDSTFQSEYILLQAWLGHERTPIVRKVATHLARKQLPAGGWAAWPGGKLEISASVKAYFALKLAGHDADADHMRRARAAIRTAGGADAVSNLTRYFLALLGQISYDQCAAAPPELMLLPRWSPVSIYRLSAWSRTVVVPLSILWSNRPQRKLPPDLGIRELFLRAPEHWPALGCGAPADEPGWFSWDRLFRRADAAAKWLERRRWRPLRGRALRAAEEWMTTRFAYSDGLGATFPGIVWTIVALKSLGYRAESLELRYNFDQLRALTIEEQDTARLAPCRSPVWDTTLVLRALAGCGLSLDDVPVAQAADWLLEKEVTRPGDWAQRVNCSPGGWYFEHHNEFYPDIDDTVQALIALRDLRDRSQRAGIKVEDSGEFTAAGLLALSRMSPGLLQSPVPPSLRKARTGNDERALFSRVRGLNAACQRALTWVLAMQNRDGGWGAFDKDNDSRLVGGVPYADYQALIDPSTPDLTGRVLEALSRWGGQLPDPHIERAVAFLRRTQQRDGCWYGRRGVNYIYGTWQALVGLAAVGVPADDPLIRRGANWLLACQHACGGWGETPESYAQPELRGRGSVTPSQTAWAVLGLIAAGYRHHPAVERAVRYLVETQNPDGAWDEEEFTGAGFPPACYLRFDYYRIYFPLLALTEYDRRTGAELQSHAVHGSEQAD